MFYILSETEAKLAINAKLIRSIHVANWFRRGCSIESPLTVRLNCEGINKVRTMFLMISHCTFQCSFFLSLSGYFI